MTISHILFSIAGVLLLILFGYHFIWGNAAYAALRPERGSEDDEGDKKFTAWLNGRRTEQRRVGKECGRPCRSRW